MRYRGLMRWGSIGLLLALFLISAPAAVDAAAADPRVALPQVGAGRVVAVDQTDTGGAAVLHLDDGTRVRLAAVHVPQSPHRNRRAAWPPAQRARAVLADRLLGRVVSLHWSGPVQDRHRRRVAHVVRAADGAWAQRMLVEEGLVRVLTFADERLLASPLLAAEAEARRAMRGLWADPTFAVRRPDTVATVLGTFQVVEGRVRAAAEVRGTLYLNFGPDWRTDFTVMFPSRGVRRLDARLRDPAAWEGQRVRARGWIRRRNGPMIVVDHPEAVEVLGHRAD